MVLETCLYVLGGALLIAAAVLVLLDAVPLLFGSGGEANRALTVLDRVLLVFVLAEVFHTVRIAVVRHEVEPEPFLVIVIIAGVRRILVVTASAEPLTSPTTLLELGLLVVMLSVSALVLVALRRGQASRP
ncbi:MAG TPA: phosphate-starvation-inducible PsiE family protein [Candidatus Dormibacteraeota bacterium]|nr:phosphate-starvation-inducible PsiE family protein [Candidatus Dormibacteraeota bacterium]